MALSNWDTLAMTADGPCDGQLTTPLGVTVHIYKNWLYVSDPAVWREGGRFVHDTVMRIEAGELTYLDLVVNAVRGPQDGVFVVASYGSPLLKDKPYEVMAGCGVYGWEGRPDDSQTITLVPGDEWRTESGEIWTPPPWVGVMPETLEYLRDHVAVALDDGSEENHHPLLLDETWAEAIRFNQGDAFMADALDAHLSSTPAGEANEPVVTRMFRRADDPAPEDQGSVSE